MPDDLDVIRTAIIETDREIAAEAWDQESTALDTDGNRSPEAMGDGPEGQADDDEDESDESEEGSEDEAEDESDKGDVKPKAETVEATTTKPEGRIPPGRLRESNERARAAEAERDALKTQAETDRANSRKEIDELRGKFDGVMAMLAKSQQPQKTEETAKTAPDLFENPDGFVKDLKDGFQTELSKRDQQLADQRVEFSMQIAHAMHKDTFTNAFQAVQKLDPRNPDDQAIVRRIYGSPNPGEALVAWHKRSETLRVVGDDPEKYRANVTDEVRKQLMADPEFRKQLLDDLRDEASGGNNGTARSITRLPKSLNGAAGGSRPGIASENFDGSDQAIADSAWR